MLFDWGRRDGEDLPLRLVRLRAFDHRRRLGFSAREDHLRGGQFRLDICEIAVYAFMWGYKWAEHIRYARGARLGAELHDGDLRQLELGHLGDAPSVTYLVPVHQ